MITLLRKVHGRFVPEHPAHRIGKDPLRIIATRIAQQVDLPREAVVEPREGAVGQIAMRVQLGRTRRIEVGAETLEGDQPGAVLGHDRVVVLDERVVEQIGQPAPPIGLPS